MQFDREDEDVPILHTRTSNADQGAQKSADDELQKAPYAPPSHRGVRIIYMRDVPEQLAS